jgi:hypothetical protein
MIDDPTQMHETLDHAGLLDDAHGEGCYALALAVPDAVDAVQRRRLKVADRPWRDDMAAQFAQADRVLYVGESGDVYSRLMDHARGDVRRAALVEAYPISDVVGVWPGDRSATAERDRARALSAPATVAYANGELF